MTEANGDDSQPLEAAALEAYRSSFPIGSRDGRLRALLNEVLDAPGALTRLRLGLLAGRTLGLPCDSSTSLATAFEYFHTASLILDDLPSMDNALERRGTICAHRKHGEAAAILGALAFINRAYALMWRSFARNPAHADTAASHAEQCLGEVGVLDGQALDLHFRSSDGSRRAVARAALGKTVSLLRLTFVTPAMLAGANRRERLLLDRLSVYWGLAYQIADDCNDLAAPGTTRKTPGRDTLLGRPNYAIAAGSVATVHQLGRLLRLTDRTLGELIELRAAWKALRPLVTHLAKGASVKDASARQCA